jgi:hypothetical protein
VVALEHRHVRLNGKYLYRWMPHDIDHSGAYFAHREREPAAAKLHRHQPGEWARALCRASCRTCVSLRGIPLRTAAFYSAVERGIARRLDADRHYTGLITKNPLHPHWRVEWRRDEPYTLPELADWLFCEDMRPDPRPDTIGAGRNVVVFDELRAAAYVEVRQFKSAGASLDRWCAHLETVATDINQQFVGYSVCKPDGRPNSGPLPRAEVRAIAKSVAKRTWQRFSEESFSARQSRLGKPGNAKRWAGHIPTEVTKPWEAEGIHRAIWYRRKKLNRNGTNCVSDEQQRSSATIAISHSSVLAGSAGSHRQCASSCSGAKRLKLQWQGRWRSGPSIVAGSSRWSTATTRVTM